MPIERGESEQTSNSIAASAPDLMISSEQGVSSEQRAAGGDSPQSRFGRWLVAGVVAIIVVALVWFGPQLWQLARDEAALEAWVTSLGWFGPLALVTLNAVQIVIAPIPGYVLQVAAGFLFGPFWGGVWASLGLLLGAAIAFWLARFYGRPLAGHLVGHDRLAYWEHLTHSDSTLLWFVLLLGPIGDIPYFLAGLARVSFAKIFVITLAVRVPSTFVVAAAGGGVMLLTWWQVVLVIAILFAILLLYFRFQEPLMRWSDQYMVRQIDRHVASGTPGNMNQVDADPVDANQVESLQNLKIQESSVKNEC
jgi:uncharacterized membrane protein YdjX (TVP38/TMEM64 family)